MSLLYQFGAAVFANWFLYMTAGPFLLDEVLKRAWPRWRDKFGELVPVRARRRIEVALIIIGVFYAGFAAFKEEHVLRVDAEQKLTKATPPPTQVEVIQKDKEAHEKLAKTEVKLTETQEQLAAVQRELAEARREAQGASAAALRAEKATQPKPLKERLRVLLDSIDPRITDGLKTRRVLFTGAIEFRLSEELQRLSKEAEAYKYVRIMKVEQGAGVSSGGTRLSGVDNVEMEVYPELLQ